MSKRYVLFVSALVALANAAFAAPAATSQPALSADQVAFFEAKIRPVLVDRCYKCHSETASKVRGGLLLDTRDGIRRGGIRGRRSCPGT
jgi:uncharacterized membrane protein